MKLGREFLDVDVGVDSSASRLPAFSVYVWCVLRVKSGVFLTRIVV